MAGPSTAAGAQQSPGRRARGATGGESHLAVDDDRAVAVRALHATPFPAREIVRDLAHPLGLDRQFLEVVNDHVRRRALAQHAAAAEARGVRGQRGEPVVRLLQRVVPGERRGDFARMLPSAQATTLLTGEVEKVPNLQGLAGILAKMQMEGTVPEELKANPPLRKTASDRSPDESRALREKANAQKEFLKRSRNGSGSGSARTVDPSDKSCEASILAETVPYEDGDPEAREKREH